MNEITPRIEYLRRQVLETPPSLRADRSLIAKRAYLEYENEDVLIRRARILEQVLQEIPISILDKELIVGLPGDALNIAQIFLPENSPEQLLAELDTLPSRDQDPFEVSDKVKADIRELAGFWGENTANSRISKMIDPRSQALIDAGTFFVQKDMGYGHCLADYAMILKKGFAGIIQDAEAALRTPGYSQEQYLFWEAVIIVSRAAINYSGRYAGLAEALASREPDAQRKKELEKIAAICRKVPAHPAETFHEALQSVWMTHLIINIESDGTGVSFGRFDQYIYPYYLSGLKSGISQDELQELLDCFWIKTNHLLKYRPLASARLWSGYIMNQNITIGGTTLSCEDAANELTYMCLECQRRLRLKEPQLSLRVSESTPVALLEKAASALSTGGGKPQFVSDETVFEGLRLLGIPDDAARDFAIIGCVEPGVVGGWGRCKSGHLSLPKILELILNNGRDPVTGKSCGLPAGEPESFRTFDDFFSAFAREFEFVLDAVVNIQKNITHRVLEEEVPHIYLSSLFPDCVEKGLDFTRGGSRYSWSSFTVTGIANVIDSLYTIKTLVYDKKEITLTELNNALLSNFENAGELLRSIQGLPKYGNDIDEVDALGTRLANMLYDTAERKRGHRDSPVTLGFVTVTKSISFGRRTGATADGRLAFQPFADGVSPSHSYDVSGPTGVMNSVGKLNLVRAGEGCILNQKFIPSALREDYQREKFAHFLKTFLLDEGGLHVQFNIVDRSTLLAAQQRPWEYRNLLVRVSGFSAYFVDLAREVQDDIIGRTEYQYI